MDNKIVNKQISVNQIIEIAKYLEKCKDEFRQRIINKENQVKEGYSKNFKEINVTYSIQFSGGKRITENGFNWFISNLNQPQNINGIALYLRIYYFIRSNDTNSSVIYNNISVRIEFREVNTRKSNNASVHINISTTHQEDEANRIEADINKILNSNGDRYNKTIKNRQIRIQSFCISVGIIISYLVLLFCWLNVNSFSAVFANFFNNKYLLIITHWFMSIVLGNLFAYWYIFSIYKPILPWSRYSGRSTFSNKSTYSDDIEFYISHSEVQFGNLWDAKERRNKIEKIYSISRIVVIVQLIISIILLLILK